MGPPGDPDTVAAEVGALADRFASLGRRLAEVARQLADGGAPPGVAIIDELDASRSQLADTRRRVVDVAHALDIPTIPPAEELSSVQALRDLAQAAVQAGKRRAAQEARRRALAVLDHVQDLRHRDDPRFPALVECQVMAARLRAVLVDVEWPATHDAMAALAEARHPLACLLEFVAPPADLDDARWEQLEDTLVAAFGRPLTVAAARGKLALDPHAPTGSPDGPGPATAEPPPPGEWADESPTITIARPSAPPPTAAGDHVACVRSLLWDALAQDRAGIAFHLAAHLAEAHPDAPPGLPPWLVRAVALGRHVRFANGDVAVLLGEDFAHVGVGDAPVDAGAGDEARAARLLLVAAALVPALVAPDTAAWSVLGVVRADDAGPHLARCCQIVADYGKGHAPIGLGALEAAANPAAWRDTLEDLLREIGAWRVRVLGLRTTFPPATEVWRQWLRPDGLIHSLLLPLTVDPRGIDVAKGLVERLSNDAQITWEVVETDRRVLGRRGDPDIDTQPAALSELRRRAREAVVFARRWVALQESRPGRAEDGPRRQLNTGWRELSVGLAAEVAALCDPSAPPPLRAAGTQCRAAIETVARLVETGLASSDEPPPAQILHADLPRVPGAPLDADWQPGQRDDEAVVAALHGVLASTQGRPDGRGTTGGAVATDASGRVVARLPG